MKTKNSNFVKRWFASLTLLALLLAAALPASGTNYTWGLTTGGSWNTAANWGGTVPNSANSGALIIDTFSAAPTLTLDNSSGITITNLAYQDKSANNYAGIISTGTGGTLTLGSPTPLVTNASPLTISAVLAGTNAWTKVGAGTLTLSSSTNTTTAGLTVSGGEVDISSWGAATANFYVGNAATTATLGIKGGTLAMGGNVFYVGQGSSSAYVGIVNQTAGTLSFSSGTAMLIGNGSGSGQASGTYNLSGGTFSDSASSTTRGVIMGVNASCNAGFNLSGTGVLSLPLAELAVGRDDAVTPNCTVSFTENGGTATVGYLSIGGQAGATGTTATFNLTNGTFVATNFQHLVAAASSSASIYLGGGAQVTLPAFPVPAGTVNLTFDFTNGYLSPLASSASYLQGLTAAYLTTNGANFNVGSGMGITVAQVLQDAPSQTGGTLTKSGAGTLTLTATSTYTGKTTVNAGTLVLPSSQTGTGNITVADGATLGVTASGSSQLSPATLMVGSSAGATLAFNSLTSTSVAPIKAGTLAASGTVTININSGFFTAGNSYPLLTWTSGSAPTTTLNPAPLALAEITGTLSVSGNTLYLNVSSAPDVWTGAVNGNWDTSPSDANWSGAAAFYTDGDQVIFNDVATGTTNVVLSGTVNPGNVVVNNSVLPYSITSSSGNNINGATGLLKAGGSSLTLSGGANTYTGPTTINGGLLSVSALAVGGAASDIGASANAATNLVINGGTLQFNATSGVGAGSDRLFTIGASGATLDGSGAAAVGGLLLTNTGPLGFASSGVNSLTLTGSTTTATNILAAVVGDNGGPTTVNKTGAGYWVLAGTNSFSGGVNLTGGTLALGNATALGASNSVLNINGGNLDCTVPNLVMAYTNPIVINANFTFYGSQNLNLGTGSVSLGTAAGTGRTNTVAAGGTLTLGGTIARGTTANALVLANSPGTLVLAGSNTYTGGTIIAAGTKTNAIVAANSHALGTGTVSTGTSGNNDASRLELSGGITITNPVTFSASRNVLAGYTTAAPNLVNLSDSNTVTSAISAGSGGSFTTLESDSGDLVMTGTVGVRTLTLQGAGNGEIHGVISGASTPAVAVYGPGQWTLSGVNTYTGGTAVNGGTLVILSTNTSSSGAIINGGTLQLGDNATKNGFLAGAITNNGNLTFANYYPQTYGGVIPGTGTLTVSNSNPLILTASNAFTGNTLISAGTLQLGDGTANLGYVSSSIITNNASLIIANYTAQTIASAISGTGPLTKSGSGVLTLLPTAGNNNYSGSTLISAGQLVVSSAQTLTGPVTLANGTTLNVAISGTSQLTPSTLTIGTTAGATLELNGVASTTTAPISAGTLVAGGPVTFFVASGSFAAGGTYPLLTWTTGPAPATILNLTGTPGHLTTNGTSINLVVNSLGDVWTGSNNGNWDTTTTGNWTGDVTIFNNGDTARFDDSAPGTTSVVVNGAIQPKSVTFNNNLLTYSVTSSGADNIGGAGGLTMAGGGTVTLVGGANTYTGATTISGGLLSVGALANGGVASDIGESANAATNLVINGGTLQYNATGGGASSDRLFTIGAAGATLDGSGSGALMLSNPGAVGLVGGGGILTLTGTATGNTLTPAVGGQATVTMSGAGSWTLAGANTYSGGTTVNAGTLQVAGSSTLGAAAGPLNVTGGTLDLGGTAQTVGTLTMNGAGVIQDGTLTATNIVAQSGILNANLAGAATALTETALTANGVSLALEGTNTFGGGVTLDQNTLVLGSATALGASNSVLTINGGSLDCTNNNLTLTNNNPITINGSFSYAGLQDLALDLGAGNVSLGTAAGTGRTITVNAGVLELDGAITNGTTANILTKAGGGVLVLTGTNTYSGGTVLAGSLGIVNALLVSNSLALGTGPVTIDASGNTDEQVLELAGNITITNAMVNWAARNDAVADILNVSGTNTVTANIASGSGGTTTALESDSGDLVMTGTFTSSSHPQTLQGAGNGELRGVLGFPTTLSPALIMNGSGVWTLEATNTYTGATAINSGTVQMGDGMTRNGSVAGPITNYAALVFANPFLQSYAGVISGSGTLTLTGPGKLTLSGANTYTGVTTLSNGVVNAGVAERAGVSGPFGSASGSETIFMDGGILQFSAANQNDYSGRFSVNQNNEAYNLDVNGQAVTLATPLASSGGTLTLLDTAGGGTLILTAANTYTGNTTISAGTLALVPGGSLSANSSVTIAAGATFDVSALTGYTLGASATLTASGTGYPATINGPSGGTVSLGSQGVTLNYDGTDTPLTVSQGTLALNHNTFTVVTTSPLAAGVYQLVSTSNLISGTVNSAPSYGNGSGVAGGLTGVVSFDTTGSNVILTVASGTTYMVTYNGNSNTAGTVPVDGNSYVSGATVTVMANTGNLVRTGYIFAGWNTAANGSGTAYPATGSATFLMGSANVTLYAQWTLIPTYTVTYSGNGNTGGTVPVDGNSYASGATVTVMANTGNLVQTGYIFAGWNTAANGSGTAYAATGSATFLMGSANVTLYAQWTPTYTVTYSGNGNTGGTVPVDGNSYTNGATVTVLANTGNLVLTGQTFLGWNTAANGSGTSYAASGSATFTIGAANVTLYANWLAPAKLTNSVVGNQLVLNWPAGPNWTLQVQTNALNVGFKTNGWVTVSPPATPPYTNGLIKTNVCVFYRLKH